MSRSLENNLVEVADVVVVGGGHAGVEAAWAAANILGEGARIVLVTLDPSKIGVMSCNPAIGGLAKGQIVREIDAFNGLMGLATDAAGIQFKVLNSSKGAAVRGPRAQCDKHEYARVVQGMIASRQNVSVMRGAIARFVLSGGAVEGAVIVCDGQEHVVRCKAVVLTTGTFMRGLMHTGEQRTAGGRFGEGPSTSISATLKGLGFELGRLKTGTPPRLKRSTIAWDALEPQLGDEKPVAFSELSAIGQWGFPGGLDSEAGESRVMKKGLAELGWAPSLAKFPTLEQVHCRVSSTNERVHDLIRKNLHRAPMYSGQIESVGPRYCPSIEDKVVRFADKVSHQVYLEPESLSDDWIYCNGISTSLPADVQEQIVHALPGCEQAEIYRYGYAVEYDMVRPHQIYSTMETKLISGLFLAGQINGTSGYEEAAAQGIVAGINAARFAQGDEAVTILRSEAYIGVLCDDLATKTPVEPYRMFTSRAEHRLSLRADNAVDRLMGKAEKWGLLCGELGDLRKRAFEVRARMIQSAGRAVERARVGQDMLSDVLKRPEFSLSEMLAAIGQNEGELTERARSVMATVRQNYFYVPYLKKAAADLVRFDELDRCKIPASFDYAGIASFRTEARQSLLRFKPSTLGQASRLEGITPADVLLLGVLIAKSRQAGVS